MIEVKFTEDSCGFKKGDKKKLDPAVARGLVFDDQIAVYTDGKMQSEAEKEIKKIDRLRQKRLQEKKKADEKAKERFDKLAKEKQKRVDAAKEANKQKFTVDPNGSIKDVNKKLKIANQEAAGKINNLNGQLTEKQREIEKLNAKVEQLESEREALVKKAEGTEGHKTHQPTAKQGDNPFEENGSKD